MARLNARFDTRAAAAKQADTLRERYASVLVHPIGKKWGISYDERSKRTTPRKRKKTI